MGFLVHLALPATLLLLVAVPRARRWAMVPAAVAGAIGWNMITAQLLDAAGLPVDQRSALVADLLLVAAAMIVGRKRRERSTAGADPSRQASRRLIALAVAGGAVIWLGLFAIAGTTPPYQDAVHHGYMVRQIEVHGTVDPEVVASLDAAGTIVSAHYYPLGMHTTSAWIVGASGARIDHVLATWALVAGAVLFPVGVAAFARDLLGDERIAGFAAVASIALIEFPYLPYTWGGLPTIVGNALAPGVAVALADAGRTGRRGQVALASLAFAGTFAITNNAVVLPLLLAACLVFRRPSVLGWREVGRRTSRLAVVGLGSLALLVPTLADARSGVAERLGLPRPATGTIPRLLGELASGRFDVGHAQLVTSALAVAGLIILVSRRMLGLPAVALTIVALAAIAWTPRDALLTDLTVPWYTSAYRIAYLLSVPKAVFVAVAAAALLDVLRRTTHRSRWPAVVALGVISILAVTDVLAITRTSAPRVADAVDAGVVLTDGSHTAFTWLASNNPKGATVASEYCDESTWMYALDELPPLFGILTPHPDGLPEMAPRIELMAALTSGQRDPRSLPLVRDLDIHYVYFGQGSICPPGERLMALGGLRDNPWLTEVFDTDGAHVFRIEQSG